MIHVLHFSDREVQKKLFAHVERTPRPCIVATVPAHRATQHPERLEPYVRFEKQFGDLCDQMLVVDGGGMDGMWRDPVVNLCEKLYPDDPESAFAAARGYLFVEKGEPLGIAKKQGSHDEDLDAMQEVLSKLDHQVPKPKKRPKVKAPVRESSSKTGRDTLEDDAPAPKHDAKLGGSGKNAFEVLGLRRGVSYDEAKKAYRALLVKYHPDKVSHLADEFKELAESRTREIMQAWEELEPKLK